MPFRVSILRVGRRWVKYKYRDHQQNAQLNNREFDVDPHNGLSAFFEIFSLDIIPPPNISGRYHTHLALELRIVSHLDSSELAYIKTIFGY